MTWHEVCGLPEVRGSLWWLDQTHLCRENHRKWDKSVQPPTRLQTWNRIVQNCPRKSSIIFKVIFSKPLLTRSVCLELSRTGCQPWRQPRGSLQFCLTRVSSFDAAQVRQTQPLTSRKQTLWQVRWRRPEVCGKEEEFRLEKYIYLWLQNVEWYLILFGASGVVDWSRGHAWRGTIKVYPLESAISVNVSNWKNSVEFCISASCLCTSESLKLTSTGQIYSDVTIHNNMSQRGYINSHRKDFAKLFTLT